MICAFQSTPPARGATERLAKGEFGSAVFQSTPPARGATTLNKFLVCGFLFQSTPPARGATASLDNKSKGTAISIHAPREGGDCLFVSLSCTLNHFNPRPPRGGRLLPLYRGGVQAIFQSTPPARGATSKTIYQTDGQPYISIHAPREGGDPRYHWRPPEAVYFNPRPPRGGRQI